MTAVGSSPLYLCRGTGAHGTVGHTVLRVRPDNACRHVAQPAERSPKRHLHALRLASVGTDDSRSVCRNRGSVSRTPGHLRFHAPPDLRRARPRGQSHRQGPARSMRWRPGTRHHPGRSEHDGHRRGTGRVQSRQVLCRARAVVSARARPADRRGHPGDGHPRGVRASGAGARTGRAGASDHRARRSDDRRRQQAEDADRPRRDRVAELHVGIHRATQGRGPDAPLRAGPRGALCQRLST